MGPLDVFTFVVLALLADVRALVREQVEPESSLVRAEAEAGALEARLDSARLARCARSSPLRGRASP